MFDILSLSENGHTPSFPFPTRVVSAESSSQTK